MRQNVVLVALSALTVASAQNQDQGRNFTVDPNSVKPSLKGMSMDRQLHFSKGIRELTTSQPIGVVRNITLAARSATMLRLPTTAMW